MKTTVKFDQHHISNLLLNLPIVDQLFCEYLGTIYRYLFLVVIHQSHFAQIGVTFRYTQILGVTKGYTYSIKVTSVYFGLLARNPKYMANENASGAPDATFQQFIVELNLMAKNMVAIAPSIFLL